MSRTRKQRRDRKGVGGKHGKLYLTFTWRGVRCKEYVNDRDTPESRDKWEKHLALIKAEISADRFDYRTWFPNGTKLAVLYPGDGFDRAEMTLTQWLEAFQARRSPYRADGSLIDDSDLNPTTWHHDASIIRKHLVPGLGSRLLSAITAADCNALRRSMIDAGLGGKSLLNNMGLLKKAFADAVEEGLIETNPVPKLKVPKNWSKHLKKQSQPLSAEEAARFLSALPKRVELRGGAILDSALLYDFYYLWLHTGWRPSEIVALRFDWLSPSRQLAELRQGREPRRGEEAGPKTGAREVLLDYDPELWAIVERRRRASLAAGVRDYLFCDSAGRPLDQEQLAKRVWKPTLRSIGVSERGQYNLRDTFITLALSAGEDPGWVAQVCGNSEQMIFRHYRNWMPDLRRGHGQKLAKSLKIGPEIGPEGGVIVPKSLKSLRLGVWRRGESNPRPKAIHNGFSVRSPVN